MKRSSNSLFTLRSAYFRLPSRAWFRFFIVILLVLGVFFRFFNLERKVYWYDEVYTSLRVSGYTRAEMVQQLFDGHVIGVEDLQKYQHPNFKKGIVNTVNGLVIEEPQLAPLYFVITRFWAQCFGSSVAAIRSLSAFISLLAFPCIYWLCLELFESSLIGWIATVILAVSPFHVIYAREARPYSLWTVTTLLLNVAFLRAVRLNKKPHWGIYAATLTAGLYTFAFTGLVAIGHGIYIWVIQGRWTKTVTIYLLASLAAFLAFTPWLSVTIANLSRVQKTTNWTAVEVSWKFFLRIWRFNISNNFIHLGPIGQQFKHLISSFLLILVGFSLYFLVCQTPKRVWSFIMASSGVPALALILPDLFWGGQRSLVARYLIPCFLGIQLAVAYLLFSQLSFTNRWQQRFWQAVTISLITGGIVSCIIIDRATSLWNQPIGKSNYQIASIVNQASHPLLITNASATNTGNIVSLSYLLDSKVKLQLVVNPNIPKLPAFCQNRGKRTCDIFLFHPSMNLQQGLEKTYGERAEPVYEAEGSIELWKFSSSA